MAQSKQDIINEIDAHIKKEGGGYKAWYVGITNDINRRLFQEHNVNKENGWWIYRQASSKDIAREIEQHFIDLGCGGSSGGGDGDSDYVYAYKKTSSTKE